MILAVFLMIVVVYVYSAFFVKPAPPDAFVLATGRAELGTLSPTNIALIAFFASLVGSLFALSPALRAARKDVVEATRNP